MFMGLVLAGFFFGNIIWGINFAVGPADQTLRLLLLVPAYGLLALFAFAWLGLATIRYTAADDGLVIAWAFKRYKIPWSDITEVLKVSGRLNLINFLGVSWPGYTAGTYEIKGVATAKIFGTDLRQLLVIKTGGVSFGITPSPEFAELVAERSQQDLKAIDTYDLPESVIGKLISEDVAYLGLLALNLVCLVFILLYLAIFFPGSGASPTIILLMVLALAIYAFNMVNASRLYHYIPMASYLLWLVGLIINIVFLSMAISVIGFGFK